MGGDVGGGGAENGAERLERCSGARSRRAPGWLLRGPPPPVLGVCCPRWQGNSTPTGRRKSTKALVQPGLGLNKQGALQRDGTAPAASGDRVREVQRCLPGKGGSLWGRLGLQHRHSQGMGRVCTRRVGGSCSAAPRAALGGGACPRTCCTAHLGWKPGTPCLASAGESLGCSEGKRQANSSCRPEGASGLLRQLLAPAAGARHGHAPPATARRRPPRTRRAGGPGQRRFVIAKGQQSIQRLRPVPAALLQHVLHAVAGHGRKHGAELLQAGRSGSCHCCHTDQRAARAGGGAGVIRAPWSRWSRCLQARSRREP